MRLSRIRDEKSPTTRLLVGLAALIEVHEKTGKSFEDILRPYLNGERPARRNPVDENGWTIPREGSFARRIYELAKQGKGPLEIEQELCPGQSHRVVSQYYRIKKPSAFNAARRFNYKKRR